MREADNIFLQKQGESYTSFVSKTYLCTTYFFKGDYDQAMTEGNKAIEMGRKLKLEDGPDLIAALEHIGLSLTRKGKAREGEPILRESLERVRKNQLTETPLVEGALGECLTAQTKFAEAEPLIVKSYDALKARQGEKGPQIAMAGKRAVELYEKWKKPELANKYRATLPQNPK